MPGFCVLNEIMSNRISHLIRCADSDDRDALDNYIGAPKERVRNDVEQSNCRNGKVLERIQLSSVDSLRFPGRRRLDG